MIILASIALTILLSLTIFVWAVILIRFAAWWKR